MKKPKIYLASTFEENKFREYVEYKYGHLIEFVDPFQRVGTNKPALERVGEDLLQLSKSDMVVAYIMKPTFGSTMEIENAFCGGKPVYVITRFSDDPWLNSRSNKLFSDIDECMLEVLNNFGIEFIEFHATSSAKSIAACLA